MVSTKDAPRRFTARIKGNLLDKAAKIAQEKRWSTNDFIEEAIILAIATYEGN